MHREDFPLIMKREDLAYFDNAATMQKPRRVIEAVREFYEVNNANPLRGLYDLSVEATRMVSEAREAVAKFIGAEDAQEVIFTSGATEGLNMAAEWVAGGEIVVGLGEHHANLLPWAVVAKRTGAKLRLAKCLRDGTIDKNDFKAKLSAKTKVVAVGLVGNVLGGENDVKRLFREVRKVSSDALCVVDAAQAVAHRRVDVRDLGADVLAFSGHKIGAPMGIGVLYGKRELLEKVEPVKVGGEMVERVSVENGKVDVKYAEVPQRFEGGTLNVGGIIGLGAAIEYLESVGMEKIERYERELLEYATERLAAIREVEVYGAGKGMIALNVAGVHAHDTAAILNEEGIAVRAGWHCAQPLLKHLGIGPVVRVSMSFYNTKEEIDKLVRALSTVAEKMGMTSGTSSRGEK